MMMCTANDTTSEDSAATSKLAINSKQIKKIEFKNELNSLGSQTNSNHQALDIGAKSIEHANGNGIIDVKQEQTFKEESTDSHQDQGDLINDADKSVIEQTEDLEYTFKPYSQDDSCDLNPEFAVICSFIIQFGERLELTLNIEQLKSSIEDQSKVDDSLIDLHVKLLKKVRRYFVRDLWEKALIRYVSEYSYEDAYEIERLGYLKTRPSIKLELLRRLMDAQFEHDQKFKPAVNLCEANELRILPTGRDLRGNTYWHQTDSNGNLRILQEQPLDYKSWKTVCSNTIELSNLIEELDKDKEERVKGEPILEPYNPLPEIFPELFIQEEPSEEEPPLPVERKTSKTRKGRGNKGRSKKNVLPASKEMEERGDSNFGLQTNDTIEQQANNISSESTHDGRTDSMGLSEPTSHDTVESQVMSAIENLINKVVSSIEYIIRPLSRNSTKQTNEEIKKEAPSIKPPKKRATKRDKPREEVLPRRASSRIQQIQQKKQAEQEEEIKKIIESNATKNTNSIELSLDDDSRSRSISSRTNRKRSESPQEDLQKNNKKKRKKGQSWRRGKGKKKLSWDKDDSDLSSTSSVTESNDENEDLDFEEDTFKIETNDFDDEFACEDEETNNEPVIIKRARTARQNLVQDEQRDLNESSIIEEDRPCRRCDKSNDPDWILLCDMCDDGYHTSCCLPPLMIVPDGDWFCPTCEHKMLLTKLQELLTSITLIIEEKKREQKKAQRIRQAAAKREPIKMEPIEDDAKRQRDFLNELNEPLALQALDDEIAEMSEVESSDSSYQRKPKSRTKKRGKAVKRSANKRPVAKDEDEELDFSINYKKTRKTYSRRNVSDEEEESDEESFGESSHYSSEEEEQEEEEEVKQKTRRARACVSYRFQEYDELIKSAIQGDSYDDDDDNDAEEEEKEDESDRESTPDHGNYGRGKDMATIEALAYQQENGIIGQDFPLPSADNPDTLPAQSKPKGKQRKKTRRLNDLDAASESGNTTSDESFQASSVTEAEDDDMTEAEISGDSDTSMDELVSLQHVRSKNKNKKKKAKRRRSSYESDDSEYQPTRSRRAASMRVSYAESTEDDDEELTATARKTKKKDTLSSGEESQVSWKSDYESVANDDDGSTSCAESPEMNADLIIHEEVERAEVTPSTRLDIGQTTQETFGKTLPPPPPVPAVPILETLQPPSTPASHVAVVKKAKTENSTHASPNTSVNTDCPMLSESDDEIAAPLHANHKPSMPLPPKQQPTTATIIAGLRLDQQGQPKIVGADKGRDPIKELIQYCNESANSAAMFDSYNQTLSTQKNFSTANASPAHPSFYEDDLI